MTVFQNRARQMYLERRDVARVVWHAICAAIVAVVCVWVLLEIPAAIDKEFGAVAAGVPAFGPAVPSVTRGSMASVP